MFIKDLLIFIINTFVDNSIPGEDRQMELDVPKAVVGGALLAQECVKDSDHRSRTVGEGFLQSDAKPLRNFVINQKKELRLI